MDSPLATGRDSLECDNPERVARGANVEIIEWFQALYRLLFVLSLLLLFVGWILSVLARAEALLPLLSLLGFVNRKRRNALAEHPEVCADCLYPVADAGRCPECGSAYDQPGAVLSQGDSVTRVPAWLRIVTVAPLVLLVSIVLTHVGTALGNQWYWGAMEVEHRWAHAEFIPASGQGAPSYELQISADIVVDSAAANTTLFTPPLDGHVRVLISGGPTPSEPRVWIDVETGSWHLIAFPNPPPAPPPQPVLGQGLESAIDEVFREAGVDGFWPHSPTEIADARRLVQLILDGKYDEFESTSGLATAGHGLRFSSAYSSRLGLQRFQIYNPIPSNWISLTLGGFAVSIPIVALVGYAIRRLLKR